MGKKRTIGLVLLIVGIVVLIVSVAADAMALGGYPGFGYKQVVGTVVGGIVSIAGVILLRRS